MYATGIATLDFGAAPGTNVVSLAITGQSSIGANAYADAFFMAGDSTADHNAYEHRMAPMAVALSIGDIVAGTGFSIHAMTQLRLSGTFKVRWVWSD